MSDEICPTPIGNPDLLKSINALLDSIPEKSFAAVIQVPENDKLKGGLYLNAGKGWSFATWIDHDLKVKKHLGYGVAVRKTWR